MVRFRVVLSYEFGEVSVEGENTKEVVDSLGQLKSIGRKASLELGGGISKRSKSGLPKAGQTEGRIKSWGPKVRNLSGKEILALLLFTLDRPTSPSDLSANLSRTWKKVSSKRISSYLTATGNTPTIRGYVTKDTRGYKLNPAGRSWVRKKILPKI